MNDILSSSHWEVAAVWSWKAPRHINALESESALALYKALALKKGDLRFPVFTDSAVVLGAHLKGRSSARLLRGPLRRVGATLAAAFGPTRLNVSDDPSRDVETRSPVPCSPSGGPCEGRQPPSRMQTDYGLGHSSSGQFVQPTAPSKFFDQTLGYPGEGPGVTIIFRPCLWALLYHLIWILAVIPPLCHAALGPRNPADANRLLQRRLSLNPGRPVLPGTSGNRVRLAAAFSQWLSETMGCSLDEALARSPFDVELFVGYLVSFGHDLYNSGRPYWHYSETINMVTSLKPILRRQCQATWDLAFTWLNEEPSTHHVAMPPIVLIAILASCLCWAG